MNISWKETNLTRNACDCSQHSVEQQQLEDAGGCAGIMMILTPDCCWKPRFLVSGYLVDMWRVRGLESGSRQLLEGTVKVTKPPGLQSSPAQPSPELPPQLCRFHSLTFSLPARRAERQRTRAHTRHINVVVLKNFTSFNLDFRHYKDSG